MDDELAGLFDLTGRVALITGGSRGLGRETAMAYALAGADVVVASRHEERCRQTAAEIADRSGRRAVGIGCHVGRWDELQTLADRVYDELGRIDILVNNAGMSPLYDTTADVTEALWRKVLDVNLSGPFRLSALVGARMAQGDGGSIINVSSVGSEHPTAATIPYAAAKAGLNAMTVGFARELAPKVRVNAVLPGAFMTDISTHWDPERFAQEARQLALRRGGEPGEIVGAMLYLASDASSYTTGTLLRVDGGYAPLIAPAAI